ncbi:MAG TPA: hypothetical protein VIX91_00980 [Candidatus Acidoferrum sp.]
MKALVSCLSVFLLVSRNTPPAQAPQTADSCHFKVSGELAKPTISGPKDITALVHIVEQPDSPVEILAIDFKDSWLSVVHERVTEQLRCTESTGMVASTHHRNGCPIEPGIFVHVKSVISMRQMICDGSLDCVERLIAFKLRCFTQCRAAEVQLLNTLLRLS